MKKITFNEEQIKDIIKLYTIDKLPTRTIGDEYNLDKSLICKLLKNNNIKLRNSGQQYKGGKKVSDKKWRDKNKKYISRKHQEWVVNNKKHVNEYIIKYRKENINKIRETKRKYEKRRKSENPTYKLICNFRTAIYTVLKEQNLTKCDHYFNILGYTQNDLIEHLEKQFKNGITWENYGTWHVDHKKAISLFNFSNVYDNEFQKCWSLDNLQPMWGKENMSKGNK